MHLQGTGVNDLKLAFLGEVGRTLPGLDPEATSLLPGPYHSQPPGHPPLSLGAGSAQPAGNGLCPLSWAWQWEVQWPKTAKLLLLEDVEGGGAFRGRWGSLGRVGCLEVRSAGPEAAFEPSGQLH